jgi:Na+/melibiose symporter-like transporter
VRRSTLRGHRRFNLLWGSQTISDTGSAVTTLAFPLLAVITLRASTFEVSLLSAATEAAFLLVALQAGALVDRSRKRRIMIWSNVIRAVGLTTVPVAHALGILTIWQMYVVALLASTAAVFFDVSYQSFLPAIVDEAQLVEANGRLGATDSFARLVGPSLGGALVGLIGAAYAVAVDVGSFIVSGTMLAAIRGVDERPPARVTGSRLRDEIREGLSFVTRHPILARVVRCTATSNFFSSMAFSIQAVFLVRVLHARPLVIGVVLSLGAIGGLLGAASAARLSAQYGAARMIWLSLLVVVPFAVANPLAFSGFGVLLVAVSDFAISFAAVVYNTAQVSYRQAVTPPRLMGRMNASVRFIVWGVQPIGAIAGGGLATLIGIRPTLFVAAAGASLAPYWVIRSPLFGMRDLPGREG